MRKKKTKIINDVKMYKNINTNELASLIMDNERFKTVLLELDETKKTLTLTYATFHREWEEIINEDSN